MNTIDKILLSCAIAVIVFTITMIVKNKRIAIKLIWNIVFIIHCIPTLIWCKCMAVVNTIKGNNEHY